MRASVDDLTIVFRSASDIEARVVRDVVSDASTIVRVSAVSIAEMAIKQSMGMLTLPVQPSSCARRSVSR